MAFLDYLKSAASTLGKVTSYVTSPLIAASSAAGQYLASKMPSPSSGTQNTSDGLFSVSRPTSSQMTTNSPGLQLSTPIKAPTQATSPLNVQIKSPDALAVGQTPSPNQTTLSQQAVAAFVPKVSPPVTVPNVISTDVLTKPGSVTLPPSPASTDYSAVIKSIQSQNIGDPQAEAQKWADSIMNQLNIESPEAKQSKEIQKTILDIQSKLGGKGAALNAAMEKAGVFGYQKQLTDINAQLQQLQAENNITKLNAQGQPIAQEEINKQTADSDRRYAVKALGLASIAQTLQGNLALAQDYAQKSIDAEYEPLANQLDYLKTALEFNQANMTRSEKQQAAKLELLIDERQRLLAEEKANKKSVFDIMTTAVKNGADAKTLNDIVNSKTAEEALLRAGDFVRSGASLADAKIFGSDASGYYRLDAQGNAVPLVAGAGNTKPATEAQLKAATFATRMSNSQSIINDLENKVYNKGVIGGAISGIAGYLPNALKSDERQMMEQAQRDFINAQLRRESGAVISPEEFNNARLQYFPQPGDSQAVIDQKRKNRDIALQGLKNEAGSAGGSTTNPLDSAFDQAGFNSVLGKTLNGLGSLSEKYESGGDPGAIGYDSTGGYSYGAYQLAHNNAKSFVEQSPYAQYFQGIPFNSQAFQQRWKQVAAADPQGFKQAQKEYIAKTHYVPQIQKLQSIGVPINQLSQTLQDVIYSTAVQHGPNNNIVAKAITSLPKNATEADLVKAIYINRWNGGQNFASSTPAVRQSVYNRFFGPQGEMNTALRNLA